VQISVLSDAGSARILVIPLHPVRFSDVHVLGREGADVRVVFPERLTDVTLVPASAKVVRPVGNVGSVVSDVQPDKFRLVVSDGKPTIVVMPAPTSVNASDNPVHPVRFSDVHVAGIAGTDVNAVSPVRLRRPNLVPVTINSLIPVGNVGSVVSDVQADTFRLVVSDGNPPIVVMPEPLSINAFGNPRHPVRFSDVHVAGQTGTAVIFTHPVRFSDVYVVGKVADCNSVSPVRLTDINLVPNSPKLVRPVGSVGSVVSDVHPDKPRAVVSDGKPPIDVMLGAASMNIFGNPRHPVRFIDVHVAGRVGTEVSSVHPVRFSAVHVAGRVGIDVSAAHPVRSIAVGKARNPGMSLSAVHPLYMIDVHVAGRLYKDSKLADPVRLIVVTFAALPTYRLRSVEGSPETVVKSLV